MWVIAGPWWGKHWCWVVGCETVVVQNLCWDDGTGRFINPVLQMMELLELLKVLNIRINLWCLKVLWAKVLVAHILKRTFWTKNDNGLQLHPTYSNSYLANLKCSLFCFFFQNVINTILNDVYGQIVIVAFLVGHFSCNLLLMKFQLSWL